MNAQSKIEAPAAVPPPADWPTLKAAFDQARAAEVAYDRDVWTPACDRRAAGGEHSPDEVEAEMERLQDIRNDAEDPLYACPAPDIAAVLWKHEYAVERWEGFEILDAWSGSIAEDLRRFSSPPAMATREQERADFPPCETIENVERFKAILPDLTASLLLAMPAATKDRAGILEAMRAMPTSDGADDISICRMVEGFTDLREWLEELLQLARAVDLRCLVCGEQVAEERGEIEQVAA